MCRIHDCLMPSAATFYELDISNFLFKIRVGKLETRLRNLLP